VKTGRVESLVSWFFTGGILSSAGLYMLIRSWLSIRLAVPFTYRGHQVDPEITLGGSLLLMIIGLAFVVRAVIGKLRSQR